MGSTTPGVVVSGLHVEIPARIAKPDRETTARIETACMLVPLRGNLNRIDEATRCTRIAPECINRLADSCRGNT